MGENLVDHQGVFDTGDDFDRTSTLGAGFYVDIAYRDVGKGREQDAEALNTRFSRPLKGPTVGEPSSSMPGALPVIGIAPLHQRCACCLCLVWKA